MVKKNDLFLIVILLCLGALPLAWIGDAPPARYAEITVDGKLERRVPLYAHSGKESFSIQTPNGTNQIQVEDGAVSVTDADCPDRICARSAPIRRPGETIACIPHKLLIEIR